MLRGGALREACTVATGGSWREILMDEAVAGPAAVAWLAVVGGCVGGIATIGV